MQRQDAYYLYKIKEVLCDKQRKNPHYSLRAYARDLDIHPATLSQVLKNNRALPIKWSYQVADKLGLSPKERSLFLESLYRTKTSLDAIKVSSNDERFMLDESYARIIAEWEHYAVLTLFDLKKFRPSITEISKKLDISETRAEVVITNLLTSGLLAKNKNGVFIKTQGPLRTTEDIASKALRESHLESLELAKQKLENTEIHLRDFSSINLAVDVSKMTEAKTIIREFRQKMAALLRDGNKAEVYQLSIQFYPLTKIEKKSR